MAGKARKIKAEKFKPEDGIDYSRTWDEKKEDWRKAEGKVYGKKYVKAQEKRIDAEAKVLEEAQNASRNE